jgi:hypothetical protein
MLTPEQIINNLNLTGNFLEASIFAELEKNDHFLVTAEWPFSQPAFQGTADLIAMNYNVTWDSEPLVFFAIECKKAKSDQKVWVFDKSRSKRDLYHPMIRINNEEKITYDARTGYLLPNLGINRIEDAPIYNKGYELRDNDGNLNRNDSERIFTSLTQANKAAIGVVKSNYKNIFKVSQMTFENRPIAIIPIVITNAELKTITYDPAKVDQKTGEVKAEDVTFENRDWVIFDYALSNELQLMGENLNTKSTIQPIKRPTYIVSASSAVSFMQELASAAEY